MRLEGRGLILRDAHALLRMRKAYLLALKKSRNKVAASCSPTAE
jgi:hypothetical protein